MSEREDGESNSEETQRPGHRPERSSPNPEEVIPDIIEELPAEQRELLLEFFAMQYRGPIPPPAMLKQFDQVVEGAAKQILDDAHAQSRHRREMEKIQVEAAISQGRLGQIFAFVIALLVIGGGIYLVATGQSAAGLAVLLPGLVGLLGLFVYSEVRGRDSSAELPQLPTGAEQENDPDSRGESSTL